MRLGVVLEGLLDRALDDALELLARIAPEATDVEVGVGGFAPAPHCDAGGWLPYLAGVYERQWDEAVVPYWRDLSAFAQREHPTLRICIELHPGTCVYNTETFERFAAIAPNLAANLDPSHLFWQQ